jgi:hypothetical protein
MTFTSTQSALRHARKFRAEYGERGMVYRCTKSWDGVGVVVELYRNTAKGLRFAGNV